MMYNRYIPSGGRYTRVIEPDAPSPAQAAYHRVRENVPPPQGGAQGPNGSDPLSSLLSGLFSGKKNAGKTGILEKLNLRDIDTGDILLLLILLFLFRDGDDIELVIALGLLLLMGLGDKEEDQRAE